MFDIPVLLALIVLVALIFDFTNGAHDCANAIATVVSTKVVTPRFAVGAAALLNLAGALLGTEVAKTLGSGIVLPQVVEGSHVLVLAALVGAIVWNCITWYFGIPSSSSHALIGGLIGAAVADAGFDALNGKGIIDKVLIPLVASPLAGFFMGYLIMWIIYWLCSRMPRRRVNGAFRRLQLVSGHHRSLDDGRACEHHAYHHGLHLWRGFHQAAFGRALERGRKPAHGMGADPASGGRRWLCVLLAAALYLELGSLWPKVMQEPRPVGRGSCIFASGQPLGPWRGALLQCTMP